MTKDYYAILLVSRNATAEEIKRAFRKLAMECHPDRNPGRESWATAKFKELNEAFGVLGDTERRRQYDQFGWEGSFGDIFRSPATRATFEDLKNEFSTSGLGFDFLDIILGNYLKGTDAAPKTSGREFKGPAGTEIPVDVSLEEIFGRGWPARQDIQYEITISREQAARGLEKELVHQGKKAMVRIPAGVRDGSKVILRDGRQTVDGKTGDIIILVRVP